MPAKSTGTTSPGVRTSSEQRLWDWLVSQRRTSEQVSFTNLSDAVGVLTLAGPKARDVLRRCSDADVSNAAFPWLHTREITVAAQQILALRLSYTGELAYELHAPMAELDALWHAIWEAGETFDISAFGSKALDMLRMEKAYRGGSELSSDATPVHADMLRFVRMEKEFIGRDAVAQRAKIGETSMLAYLEVDGADAEASGGEPVYDGERLVGSVSSAAPAVMSGKSLAFAYLNPNVTTPGTALGIQILGQRCSAVVLARAAYDPDNRRLRA